MGPQVSAESRSDSATLLDHQLPHAVVRAVADVDVPLASTKIRAGVAAAMARSAVGAVAGFPSRPASQSCRYGCDHADRVIFGCRPDTRRLRGRSRFPWGPRVWRLSPIRVTGESFSVPCRQVHQLLPAEIDAEDGVPLAQGQKHLAAQVEIKRAGTVERRPRQRRAHRRRSPLAGPGHRVDDPRAQIDAADRLFPMSAMKSPPRRRGRSNAVLKLGLHGLFAVSRPKPASRSRRRSK